MAKTIILCFKEIPDHAVFDSSYLSRFCFDLKTKELNNSFGQMNNTNAT